MSAALQPPSKSTPAQDAFLRDKLDIDPAELHEIEQERALFSRFPPDFDTFTDVPGSVSLTPEQRKELDAAMAKMLARAEKMKAKMQAAGGPVDLDKIDTEVFGHIPRNFVPPQFKKELQDWRVTRDAMNDRAVKAMMERSADPAATAQKVTGTLSTLSSIAGVGVQGAEMVKVFSPEKAEAIGAIIGYIGQGLDSTGTAIAGGKAAKERATEDLGPVEQKMKDEKIISSLGTLMGTGVDIAAEFVPLLGTLKSGAETVAALKETVERVRLRSATGDLRDEAMARVASQLSKAFDQAAGREGRLGAEAGVEATQKAIGTAAGVARDTGVGIKVAAALTIVEKTIMVGGKVVFAAIDWSEAEKAVKTLNDARAGSEKAQQQVFADHPHYAKMLIAIMAKKQDPLAMKYLVERGLTEQDINDKRTSIDILADYALEQSQETDEPKTLGQTIDGVLDTVRGGAEKLKGACEAAGKWLGLLKDNPKLVPPPLPQIYSAEEIGKMRAALQDAKDKKAAAEKAGKEVPTWVEQNIKNLEAELARLARDLREQWNSVKAEQVNWDLIASGHAPPAKDGKAPNAEQAAKLRDEARIASAHLAELYQACVT